MKSRDDKIRDIAAELRRELPSVGPVATDGWAETMAERLLDAAEREEPAWPTKESFHAALEVFSNFDEPVTPLALQSALAAAMHADPIIQAALRWAREKERTGFAVGTGHMAELRVLLSEIRDAGLLDGTEGK